VDHSELAFTQQYNCKYSRGESPWESPCACV